MTDPLLLYGATGYTGRLLLDELLATGVRPILGGRNEAKLRALAEPLGLPWRTAQLGEPAEVDAALRDVHAVLHAAGPFSTTSRPMVDGCLRTGVHYLDVTGEIPVIEALAKRHAEARRRGIMIVPGVGFDVVPSDCLAAHVAARLPGARRLVLAITGLEFATPGSAKTLVEHAFYGVQVRRDGEIVPLPGGVHQRSFDFGQGARPCLSVLWGDVASAYYTTGIPDIDVYFEATPPVRFLLMASRYFGWALATSPWQTWLKAQADMLPQGPTGTQRAQASDGVVVAEATDGRGGHAAARLRTPEIYTFTGMAGAAVARRVLRGDVELGFQTPARLFGPDFVLGFRGVSREDLA